MAREKRKISIRKKPVRPERRQEDPVVVAFLDKYTEEAWGNHIEDKVCFDTDEDPYSDDLYCVYFIPEKDVTEQKIIVGKKYGIPPEELKIAYEHYHTGMLCLIHMRPEPEESFNKRLEEYQKEQDKYDQWYDKNRSAIEEELARRELAAAAKKSKKIAKLQAELTKLKGD